MTLSVRERALERKIAWSTVVQYGGKVIQMLLAVVAVKLVAGYLSKETFGLYAAVTEYALFFSVAANLGIFGNVVRRMADDPADGTLFANALVLRIGSALAFFASGVLALVIMGAGAPFALAATVFFGALLVDYVTSVCDAMLQANYLMGRATLAQIIGRLIQVGLVFWFVRADPSEPVLAYVAIVLASSIGTAALSYAFVRRRLRPSTGVSWTFMRGFFLGGIAFGIINIVNNLYFRFLPDLVAHRILSSADFATFSLSFRISQVIALASTFFMFSVLPAFKRALDAGDHGLARRLFAKAWKIIAGAGALLVLGGAALSPWLISLLAHKKYVVPEFRFVLPLMLLLAAVSYGYDLVLVTLFALEEERWFLRRELFALALGGACFFGAFHVAGSAAQLAAIIGGAVLAETFMVVSGVLRIRKVFRA